MKIKLGPNTTIEIRKDDTRHKFESALAEYMYHAGLEGSADQEGGSVEYEGYFWRFGRRILWEDPRGFVSVDTWKDEGEAEAHCNDALADYGGWLDLEEDDTDDSAWSIEHNGAF